VADGIERVPGVSDVARVRSALLQVDGDRDFATAVDPDALDAVARPQVSTGSFADLDATSLALSADFATEKGLGVGSTVTLGYAGEETPVTVVATYQPDSVLQSDVTMSLDGFEAIGVPPTDRAVYVLAQPGTDRAALAAGLDRVVADLPTVSVNDQAAFAAEQRRPIDRLLFIVYALLGLAVVIAVLGIVNTLALSVLERTHEIGMLRAVGMTRRQLRRSVRWESVIIAAIGGSVGLVLGLIWAWAFTSALESENLFRLSVPVGRIVLLALLSLAAGAIAAVIPAWRASRLEIFDAIGRE
jgi:putative ABC transport system permease protein